MPGGDFNCGEGKPCGCIVQLLPASQSLINHWRLHYGATVCLLICSLEKAKSVSHCALFSSTVLVISVKNSFWVGRATLWLKIRFHYSCTMDWWVIGGTHTRTHTQWWMAKAGPRWSSWRQVTVWSLKDHMNMKSGSYGAKRPVGLLVMSSQILRGATAGWR